MALQLYGYRFSVYLRIVRMVLAEKDLAYDRIEVDPFDPPLPPGYLSLNPFGRVPTLCHGDFVIYETGAITRYLDEAFSGADLQPAAPRSRARMTQVMSIVDAYAYWPWVRQIYSNRVFLPALSEAPDREEIQKGLAGSRRPLAALETIAAEGLQLNGQELSLADLYLGAMMAYLTAAPEGADLLADHPNLSAWWLRLSHRPSLVQTDPGLPGAS